MSSHQLTPSQRRAVVAQYRSRFREVQTLERHRARYIRYFNERVNRFHASRGYPAWPVVHPCETNGEFAESVYEFVFQYNQCVIESQRLPLSAPLRWDTNGPMLRAFFGLYRRTVVYAYAEEQDTSDYEKEKTPPPPNNPQPTASLSPILARPQPIIVKDSFPSPPNIPNTISHSQGSPSVGSSGTEIQAPSAPPSSAAPESQISHTALELLRQLVNQMPKPSADKGSNIDLRKYGIGISV
ncbi:hypothetical protein SISSUDRAFT_1066300 [Sistotremastrum suecicum HHB10207 ss-3]|uniref:Uncharacterized protein n=1 Tax=Sistotremastrum suecicum HHB10207 ss-3 TaxID=1314776 RepID=A0A165YH78_9AGAM|nr:hypothetical protein SISSUDRAFT_1066300 [Sistotremastrum suecicum HHB10207 ss-3]